MMNKPRRIFDSGEGGLFQNIADHLKLVWRLMQDDRVNPFLKILPLGSLVYLVSPLDMAIPVVDDIGVIWFFTYMFIELCPEDIVEEHRAAIQKVVAGNWKKDEEIVIDEADIEDAEFTEKG